VTSRNNKHRPARLGAAKLYSTPSANVMQGSFSGVLAEAKASAESERKAVLYCVRSESSLVPKLLEYIEELEMEGSPDLDAFEKKALPYFPVAKPGDKQEEFSHEQGQLHREYCDLFEAQLKGFLQTHSSTVDELYAQVRAGMQKDNRTHESKPGLEDDLAASGEVVQMICAATDFAVFDSYMRSLNALREASGIEVAFDRPK